MVPEGENIFCRRMARELLAERVARLVDAKNVSQTCLVEANPVAPRRTCERGSCARRTRKG